MTRICRVRPPRRDPSRPSTAADELTVLLAAWRREIDSTPAPDMSALLTAPGVPKAGPPT